MAQEIEPGFFLMNDFKEVKPFYVKLFVEKGVQVLYKLRNWRERYHPEFLTKGEMYFTKPNELNDPFDIHRPLTFDVSVVETPAFLQKMIETAPEARHINTGRDAEIYAENELAKIRADPNSYFLNNYNDLIKSEEYNNQIGVFSLTIDPINDQLWGYYGGGQRGFAVGFDPIQLCEDLFSQGHFINYSDKIPASSIINLSYKAQSELMFQKNKKWEFESEFRFVRLLDTPERRKHTFQPGIVKEIILGPRIANEDEYEIIEVLRSKYPHVALYRIVCNYKNGKIGLVEQAF
jgi:hypothetical protein